MPRPLIFPCEGDALAGSLHPAAGRVGVVIVTGGQQTRHGSHRSFVVMAERLAKAGFPVLRFDRRGVGDSDGIDPGFRASGPDIVAARDALLAACAGVHVVVGWGLCDGASALAMHPSGFAGLILANPWTLDADDDATQPQAPAIAAHYANRIASPAAWRRLMTGAVNLRALASGLGKLIQPRRITNTSTAILAGLVDHGRPALILLAERDGTAQAFAALLEKANFADLRRNMEIKTLAGATHTFPGAMAETQMIDACVAWLERLDNTAATESK